MQQESAVAGKRLLRGPLDEKRLGEVEYVRAPGEIALRRAGEEVDRRTARDPVYGAVRRAPEPPVRRNVRTGARARGRDSRGIAWAVVDGAAVGVPRGPKGPAAALETRIPGQGRGLALVVVVDARYPWVVGKRVHQPAHLMLLL